MGLGSKAADDATNSDLTNSNIKDFPQYPGEGCLQHAAAMYKEQVETRLAANHLLVVAQGGSPPAADCIIDVSLSDVPLLPTTHRDYERRMETRIKIQNTNAQNAVKRYNLTMDAWTEIYTLFKTSTESAAPALSRELKELCDLSQTRKLSGGYFDGPRAYRLVMHRLSGGARRTHADKDFYRQAERIQLASPLADGCLASEYTKRALAFLVHIRPFLAQSYDDDDTTQYIIRLMPKSLREGGRRIEADLIREGKHHEFMTVIQRCRELVQEEQKAAPPATAVAPAALPAPLAAAAPVRHRRCP